MPLLEVKNLSKSYANVDALIKMDISVNVGEIVALIGKNGAGKTTLLNCIAGNIYPTGGNILYKGETLLQKESKLNEFGILIEPTFIPYMNAADNLSILLKAAGVKSVKKNVEDILKLVGLENKKKEKTKAFSFGMCQRLGLAQALLNEPQFLILDEPFVGLDPTGKAILKNIILQKAREEKVGILFSSHDLEDVEEICDRVVLIENGRKKYDGVMDYDKKYILKCDKNIDEDTKRILLNCNIKGKEVIVDHAKELGIIFKKLDEVGINVIDLEIKQRSLYDFFKQEGGE
ncbi:ABC transporter ATP-binding protein [Lachnospiraceae bacterium MD1]|jgi:ABC-2 type transport system ATP-binding protein|uniref:ABC transporter ATP-binding protein n=1 Tax=Variimorphobacter saccharofermentans TaxID=2755051 RepID=A0A839JY21_9FIRM|nr:ABC transporter ATP-binding protein [Variimorphobacter saccharofermentans]MBB2181882.1 ABC transporter ATP-binding protein [Variimorphobacter saccharofermentans]